MIAEIERLRAEARRRALLGPYSDLRLPPLAQDKPEPEEGIHVRDEDWYRHTLLLADTGGGKTNVIRWRIMQLLPLIAKGLASLILIDPIGKGVLTEELLRLKLVWDMRERVILIEPLDPNVSVNIFESDGTEKGLNQTLAHVFRVFATVTKMPTELQDTVLRFALRALFAAPGDINIYTLMSVLEHGLGDIPISSLSTGTQRFFSSFAPGKNKRAQEVLSRLEGFLGDPIFETLFSSHETTFDLFKEMQAGRLIIINAADAPAVYGNFWIEEVVRCLRPRMRLPEEKRTPTTFIIDEAQEFIKKDLHFARILDKAREARIATLIAIHHLGQIEDDHVKHSLVTNTKVKFIARTSADVSLLTRSMRRTRSEDLIDLDDFEFAFFAPNMGGAEIVKLPLVDFRDMPSISERRAEELRDMTRPRRKAVPPAPPKLRIITPQPEAPRRPRKGSIADAL